MAYKIIDLGALNGDFSHGNAINSESQVTGCTGNPQSPNNPLTPAPFLWTQGSMQVLNFQMPMRNGQAFDINCACEIVGFLYDGTADHATIWVGQSPQSLPFRGDDTTNGRSINDCGLVAGDGAGLVVGNTKAFNTPFGKLDPFPSNNPNVLPRDRYCRAYSINARGQIVGGSDTGNPIRLVAFAPPVPGVHACLWDKGQIFDLGTLHPNEGSEAYGINDRSQIVGRSGSNAFLWRNGAMTDLGAGSAFNVNNAGAIIGDTFLWQNGNRTTLSNLLSPGSGWQITEGRDINDAGEIVGTGVHNGHTRAFLMWP